MDLSDLAGLVFRWMHLLSAITAVGGTVFVRFVVLPTLQPLPPDQRQALHAAMRARWSKFVAAAIGFLLLSGFYNFLWTAMHYTLPRWYHPLFGVKFLAALGIFLIASLLTGKSAASEEIRKHAPFWLNLNISLAILVVCLSGVLRTADKVPKDTGPDSPATVSRLAASERLDCG